MMKSKSESDSSTCNTFDTRVVMNHKIMPPGYELDDYWMQNIVLKDPKEAEDEFYSAYAYFTSSSLHTFTDYEAKRIAAAPPYNWFLHHSKNRLCCLTADQNKTEEKKNNNNTRNHKRIRSPLEVIDQVFIKKKPRLILGFKKQNNSNSWSVTIKESHVAENPHQKEEDSTQKQLHMMDHTENSDVTSDIISAPVRDLVPVLPIDQEGIKNLILAEMGGCDELVLVIDKKLTQTDVGQQQNRLSIPKLQVKNEFLNSQEKALLIHPQQKLRNISSKLLIHNQHECKVHNINLTYWKMNKSYIYVLNGGWYELVLQHNLEQGMDVQLWAFRVHSQLCFALVRS